VEPLVRIRTSNVTVPVFSFVGAGLLRLLGNYGAIAVFFSLAFINIFRRKWEEADRS
jgi:hypothetical protein